VVLSALLAYFFFLLIDVIPRANLRKNVRLILWRKSSKIRDMKLTKIGQNLKKK